MFRKYDENDLALMEKAISLAKAAIDEGNLPIAAVAVLDGTIIAQSHNCVLQPTFHPSRHAETLLLGKIDGMLLRNRSKDIAVYTTSEPCVMCVGALVLHRIGRVFYGAKDDYRGGVFAIKKYRKIYEKDKLPTFIGPLCHDRCNKLTLQADKIYRDYWGEKNGNVCC